MDDADALGRRVGQASPTRTTPSRTGSNPNFTGKNCSITQAFVVVWRVGLTVVKAPPPARASGIRSWSARWSLRSRKGI